MLYTIEHFRNTGEVLERLTKMTDADFRVTAPSEGSFLELVTHYAAPVLADMKAVQDVLHVPFDKLFPYVLSKIIPKASGSNRLADIADKQAEALIEAEKTRQARETTAQVQAEQETERLRIIAAMLRNDGNELRDNIAEAEELGKIIGKHANGPARLASDEGTADFIASELNAEVERERIIEASEAELNRIDPNAEQELVDKVRRIMPEVGTPLKRSATKMDFELSTDGVPIASLNQHRIDQIAQLEKDDTPLVLHGSLKKLDKETGYGRFRPTGSRTTMSFVIPKDIFTANKQSFIDAFTIREVAVEVIPYRDGVGNIVKLTILRVVPPNDIRGTRAA